MIQKRTTVRGRGWYLSKAAGALCCGRILRLLLGLLFSVLPSSPCCPCPRASCRSRRSCPRILMVSCSPPLQLPAPYPPSPSWPPPLSASARPRSSSLPLSLWRSSSSLLLFSSSSSLRCAPPPWRSFSFSAMMTFCSSSVLVSKAATFSSHLCTHSSFQLQSSTSP